MNTLARFESKFIKTPDCWEWIAAKDRHGYGMFQFEGRVQKASRVSWRIYKGDIPNGACVCHRCDNPACINPDHLFIGTQKENVTDMVSKERNFSPVGTKNGRAKLDVTAVLDIRSSTESLKVLAERYSVSSMLISLIRRGKRWQHV